MLSPVRFDMRFYGLSYVVRKVDGYGVSNESSQRTKLNLIATLGKLVVQGETLNKSTFAKRDRPMLFGVPKTTISISVELSG